MKHIKFITTFSKNGYELYGKSWIDTFTKNVKEQNISVDLYLDFTIPVTDNRITIIDYDSVIPDHKNWITEFESKSQHSMYNKKMGIRFSFKSFVMQHALDNNTDCYVVWLDGDCVFKQNSYEFVESLLGNTAIACQREDNGGVDHIESGIVVFDVDHADVKIFNNKFKQLYNVDALIQCSAPYDGFMIYKALKESNIHFVDLNAEHGKHGIQSDPTQTFLHPELCSRFYHNIGPVGKSNYDSWETVSEVDEFFKLSKAHLPKTSAQINQARLELVKRRNEMRKLA